MLSNIGTISSVQLSKNMGQYFICAYKKNVIIGIIASYFTDIVDPNVISFGFIYTSQMFLSLFDTADSQVNVIGYFLLISSENVVP
jgi:hypothetical protein